VPVPSAFAGFRFPPEVILLAVRWYMRYGLSYRDLEELLAERGIEVDHVTLYRWVWRYVYRAVDQHGQVIDVLVSRRRDLASARRFFATALAAHRAPVEFISDMAAALANVIEELIPAAFHTTGQYENNRREADHGRLKARLRPMRGLKTDRTASVVIRGHAFIQNLRRGHYELGVEVAPVFRLATAFDELQRAIWRISPTPTIPHALRTPNATPPLTVNQQTLVRLVGERSTLSMLACWG
jgi:transposase-like protein